MPVLAVADLHKSFGGREVVNGVSFALERGECFALLGPNGAGKTTTLRCLLGLSEPERGSIELLGLPVPQRAREARQRVGVVPQFDNLDPDFTVRENIMVFGRYFGLSDAAIKQRLPELLDFAQLTERAEARIQTLSGGMKRRLTLARALVNDPDLLFLDEPTTGLDPQARHLLWERLRRLLNQGKTILLTTHFMEEAERLAHRLIIMDAGRVIAQGKPRELVAQHIEPEVVEVFGDGVQLWFESHGAPLAARAELTGETAFCYSADASALVSTLQQRGELRYLRRPANLEDLFLKLTGRELRD